MTTNDVVLIISVAAATGRRDELVDALRAILPETRAFEGNVGVELLVTDDDPDGVVLVEHWRSLDAYGAYKAWRAESGTSVLGSDLVSGTPETVVCRTR